ncbi:MAG: AAA family ATPase [Planctomycetota bacterium]
MKTLACYHLKGGVGKTATSVNLGYLLAARGATTLIWDLDPQGATTFYFRVKPKVKGGVRRLLDRDGDPLRAVRGTDYEGLDLLPADFSARHLDIVIEHAKKPKRRFASVLKTLRKHYDYVLLDCAPSIGLASESMFRAVDALVVPVIPTTLSLHSLEQLCDHLDDLKKSPRVWPFFSMVDRRKALHREVCDQARSMPYDFLEAMIPYSSHVERMGVRRAPLPSYAPTSSAARAYRKLVDEIVERSR